MIRIIKKIKLFTLAVLLFTGTVLSVDAENISEQLTPKEVLKIARLKLGTYGDYKVKMKLSAVDNEEKQNQIIWYSKDAIKLEQLGPFNKGAIIVISQKEKEKKIRAHLGGKLSFFVVSLSDDSSWLKGVTGDTAHYVDFESILKACEHAMDKHLKDYKIKIEGNEYIVVAKIDKKDVKFDFIKEEDEYRFTFDKKDLNLIKLERFKDGNLLNTVEWYELETNLKFKKEIFDL